MSYANGTEHYNLPQTVGTDKRDWFDTNAAFAAIDAALYAAATGQAADAEAISSINGQITTIQGDITSLQGTVGGHTTQIGALQSSVSGLSNTVADVRQDAEDMISAYNEGAAETSTHAYAIGDYFIYNDVLYKATAAIDIGDTIVPNTNCQATNVTTQIKALESVTDKVGDLANLTTTDKSSAVAAINEVNAAAGSAAAAVGTLSDLTTTDKTSAVAAINEVKSDLNKKKFGIDTSNVLYSSGVYLNDTKSYTATEDCVVCCSGAYVDQMLFRGTIDSVEVFKYGTYASNLTSPTVFSHTINLAKGSTFAYVIPNTAVAGANGQFTVYGLK